MLHLVDLAPMDDSDPVENAKTIIRELVKFSPELAARECWLVLNKMDLLPEAEAKALSARIVKELNWEGPLFHISGVTKVGTKQLCYAVMDHLERLKKEASLAAPLVEAEPENLWQGLEGLERQGQDANAKQLRENQNVIEDDEDLDDED
jgi:GTP-binding protein